MSAAGPKARVSIVVPTFREGPNLKPLIERTFASMSSAGIDAEMIVVDDNSQDDTEAVVASLAARHPVRLIVRRGERGLSSAVLAGFREARFDVFVVMDADLQHPPELVPALVQRLADPECDFAIGTRYAADAEIAENWPLFRRLNSRLAIWLARPLTPLSDPMSGFFALRRETWQHADRLDPIGYKIGLELYVKGRCRRPVEIPIRFDVRAHGVSKTTVGERLRYLRHLWRLYLYRFPRAVSFGVVLLVVVLGLAVWAFVRAVWFG